MQPEPLEHTGCAAAADVAAVDDATALGPNQSQRVVHSNQVWSDATLSVVLRRHAFYVNLHKECAAPPAQTGCETLRQAQQDPEIWPRFGRDLVALLTTWIPLRAAASPCC